MNFASVLFPCGYEPPPKRDESEYFFVDLQIEQIISGITDRCQAQKVEDILHTPLDCADAIHYRQEVFRDVQRAFVREGIQRFAASVREMTRFLQTSQRVPSSFHRQGWFVRAADIYCEAVSTLAEDLTDAEIRSRALRHFRRDLNAYVQSESFSSLKNATRTIREDLSEVKFALHIKGQDVQVREYRGEPDYGARVQSAFERLSRDVDRVYVSSQSESSGVSRLEIDIAESLTRFYPQTFRRLEQFCTEYARFLADGLLEFHRDMQFYLAYLQYTERLRESGLQFCYPDMTAGGGDIHARHTFDLALASKLASEGEQVIPNNFYLCGGEQIFVVSGANQGGKTTFARTFGQLHFLAALGCPVPGSQARLHIFDHLLTHFEQRERIADLRGRMEDDLLRIRYLLRRATPDSIIILNEIFTSATLQDEKHLSKKILCKILDLGSLCVWVSFIEELPAMSDATVSMVAAVDPSDPAVRTYRVERRPPDGSAYALSIAEKYRLTRKDIEERVP